MSASAPDFEPDGDAQPEKPEQNPSALTAEGQGSNIPLGWKPTEAHPVPVVRCVQIKKDGTRCKQWSLRGYTKCRRHAGPGALMKDGNVQVYAQAVIEAGRLRLIDSVDPAIDQLLDLMSPGSAEAIRLKAAESVLDRAGIRGGFEIAVEADIIASPADELKKRLGELHKGAAAVKKIRDEAAATSNPDIVDADVVEDDDPDQLGLFELGGEDE